MVCSREWVTSSRFRVWLFRSCVCVPSRRRFRSLVGSIPAAIWVFPDQRSGLARTPFSYALRLRNCMFLVRAQTVVRAQTLASRTTTFVRTLAEPSRYPELAIDGSAGDGLIWTLLLSFNGEGSGGTSSAVWEATIPGEFGTGGEVGDARLASTHNYRIARTAAQLNAANPHKLRIALATGASGQSQDFEGPFDLTGLGNTCSTCNCAGNEIKPPTATAGSGLYWHGGRGGCYGSPHYGLARSSSNTVWGTCMTAVATNANDHKWGHFHRGGVDTGVYAFGDKCVSEVEWDQRFLLYMGHRKSCFSSSSSGSASWSTVIPANWYVTKILMYGPEIRSLENLALTYGETGKVFCWVGSGRSVFRFFPRCCPRTRSKY